MRPEEISDALNQLDDDLIKETEQVRRLAKRRKKRSGVNWKMLGTVAACLGLFMIGNIVASKFVQPPVGTEQTGESGETADTKQNDESSETSAGEQTTGEVESSTDESRQETDSPQPTETEESTSANLDLPVLSIDALMGNLGSGGGSHIVVADLEEWISSPWTEGTTPNTLPVYDNYKYTEYFTPYGFDRETMAEWVYFIVDALDAKLLEMEYHEAEKYDGAYMRALTDFHNIYIYGDGDIEISFFGVDFPEECLLTRDLSAEERLTALDNLVDYFSDLLDYAQPEKAVEISYSYTGTENQRCLVYDRAENITDALLNHRYHRAEFEFGGSGEVLEIQISNGLSCAEKIGDYPTISVEEARELLLAGNFFYEGASDFSVEEEKIAGVELIYPTSNMPEIIIPYYCFYIELPDDILEKNFPELNDSGLLKQYQCCYVPAIDSQYIENMPHYGGLSQ